MECKLYMTSHFQDGTVRQHDLRAPHNCGPNSCPAPLIQLDQELCTLSLSPLTPYQIVVAGDAPYVGLHVRDIVHLAYLILLRVTSTIVDTRALHWKLLGVEYPDLAKNSQLVSAGSVQDRR